MNTRNALAFADHVAAAGTAAPAGFHLRLMGDVALATAHDASRIPARRHALALLALLALAPGRSVSRASAAALIWAGRDRSSALGSLRQCLLHLDDLCPDGSPVVRTARLLQLAVGVTTDVDRLQALPRGSDPGAIGTAIDPPFLAGIDVNAEIAAWVIDRRQKLAVLVAAQSGATAVASGVETLDPPGTITAGPALAIAAAPPPRPAAPIARSPASPHAPPLFRVLPILDGAGLRGDQVRAELITRLSRFREIKLLDDAPDGAAPDAAFRLTGVLGDVDGQRMLNVRLVSVTHNDVIWADSIGLDTGFAQELDRIAGRIACFGLLEDWPDTDLIVESSGAFYARFVRCRMMALWPRDHDEALEAERELRQMMLLQPRFAFAPLALSRLLNTDYGYTRAFASGPEQWQAALDLARSALAMDRGLPAAWLQVGFSLLRRREWGAAQLHIEKGAELNPYDHTKLNIVATAFLYLGETERSETYLMRSLALMRGPSSDYLNDLGLLRLVQGRPGEAHDAMVASPRPMLFNHILATIAAHQSGHDAKAPAAAARQALAPIFPGRNPPATAAIRDWFIAHHPFRDPATRKMLARGIDDSFT